MLSRSGVTVEVFLMLIQLVIFWLEGVLCVLGHWNEEGLRICWLVNII